MKYGHMVDFVRRGRRAMSLLLQTNSKGIPEEEGAEQTGEKKELNTKNHTGEYLSREGLPCLRLKKMPHITKRQIKSL